MAGKFVEYEGKIKIKENTNARMLLGLLKYLVDDLGFSIKQLESDEIKLIKNEYTREHEGDVVITKSNVQVEIEIEVSEGEIEIEVESASMDLVKNLTSEIASKI